MKVLFFGHSLITRRQWSFVKILDETTPLDVTYYPPKTWVQHKFQGKGKFHEVDLTNPQDGIWGYYYEPQYILEQIDKYKPIWIGGFVEPYSVSGAILQKCAKETGVKTFFFSYENVSNNFFRYPSQIKSLLTNIPKADLILCGNKNAQKFMNVYGAKKTEFIPHTGVDTDFWKFDNTVQKIYDGIFLGRKVPEKGWELIEKHIKGKEIVFAPDHYIPDNKIVEFMNRGKYFVHSSLRIPTWKEQLGFVIAEALACGLPVMMSKYGSQVEQFANVPGVIIYDPLDKESTLFAIQHCKSKGHNYKGREWIIENFSNEVISKKYYEVLK